MKSNTVIKRENNQQQPWRLKAAATLISNHKSIIKIIALWKNTFQNTGGLQKSSNVNEVIRTVLNSFFYEKILHTQGAQKTYKQTKTKNAA